MMDRHEKWVPVESGHVIPAGQPHRVERGEDLEQRATEYIHNHDHVVGPYWNHFVDSTWKPPLELPTEPTWGIAIGDGGEVAGGQWSLQGTVLTRKDGYGESWLAKYVCDFIPLTPEQVARIEAAR